MDSIGALVLSGLTGAVLASSSYLAMQAGRALACTHSVCACAAPADAGRAQVDAEALARSGGAPLVEVALELAVPHIAWAPGLGPGGLAGMFDAWLAAFCQVGAAVTRLDIGEGARRQAAQSMPTLSSRLD